MSLEKTRQERLKIKFSNYLDYSQADMRDTACEAVVLHREQAVTMQSGLPEG